MKKIAAMCFLLGCASTPQSSLPPASPHQAPKRLPFYKIGDCLMLVDPVAGSKPTRHRMRVEKISLQEGRYWYRWLLDSGRWDSELASAVGKFEVLERITQKVRCP